MMSAPAASETTVDDAASHPSHLTPQPSSSSPVSALKRGREWEKGRERKRGGSHEAPVGAPPAKRIPNDSEVWIGIHVLHLAACAAAPTPPSCEHFIVKLSDGTFHVFLRVPWDRRWKSKDKNVERTKPWAAALGCDMGRRGAAWRRIQDDTYKEGDDHLKYPVFASDDAVVEFAQRSLLPVGSRLLSGWPSRLKLESAGALWSNDDSAATNRVMRFLRALFNSHVKHVLLALHAAFAAGRKSVTVSSKLDSEFRGAQFCRALRAAGFAIDVLPPAWIDATAPAESCVVLLDAENDLHEATPLGCGTPEKDQWLISMVLRPLNTWDRYPHIAGHSADDARAALFALITEVKHHPTCRCDDTYVPWSNSDSSQSSEDPPRTRTSCRLPPVDIEQVYRRHRGLNYDVLRSVAALILCGKRARSRHFHGYMLVEHKYADADAGQKYFVQTVMKFVQEARAVVEARRKAAQEEEERRQFAARKTQCEAEHSRHWHELGEVDRKIRCAEDELLTGPVHAAQYDDVLGHVTSELERMHPRSTLILHKVLVAGAARDAMKWPLDSRTGNATRYQEASRMFERQYSKQEMYCSNVQRLARALNEQRRRGLFGDVADCGRCAQLAASLDKAQEEEDWGVAVGHDGTSSVHTASSTSRAMAGDKDSLPKDAVRGRICDACIERCKKVLVAWQKNVLEVAERGAEGLFQTAPRFANDADMWALSATLATVRECMADKSNGSIATDLDIASANVHGPWSGSRSDRWRCTTEASLVRSINVRLNLEERMEKLRSQLPGLKRRQQSLKAFMNRPCRCHPERRRV